MSTCMEVPQKPLSLPFQRPALHMPHIQYVFTQWVFHYCLFESTVGSYIVYEITVSVGLYTTTTTTRAGSAIINSHTPKMITFLISLVPTHKSLGMRLICDLYVNSTSSVTVITCTSATVNSHILRMDTVVRSIWVSWAGGQPWFCTNAIDIVQPDSSTCRPKPTKQKSLKLCTLSLS